MGPPVAAGPSRLNRGVGLERVDCRDFKARRDWALPFGPSRGFLPAVVRSPAAPRFRSKIGCCGNRSNPLAGLPSGEKQPDA